MPSICESESIKNSLLLLQSFKLSACPRGAEISSLAQDSISVMEEKVSESITAPNPTKQPQLEGLTQEDLTKINFLLRRLCLLNHLDTVTHLAITALLANLPLESVFLSVLIHSFTSQPDLARPMSLLTHLRHNPHSHPHLTLHRAHAP
ncbi:hypothetical protein ACFX13_022149 [Malus domestica]